MFKKQITDIVKGFLSPYINQADNCLDLTLGNGYDTLYLCQNVGEDGRVYGFDIQDIAINNTKELLDEHGLLHRATIIKDSHANIRNYINCSISVAMMNLGYLPSGDKSIITKSDTTIEAIKATLHLLKKGGVLSIVIYYGHEGGCEEKDDVVAYLTSLCPKVYEIIHIAYPNRSNYAPLMYFIMKK